LRGWRDQRGKLGAKLAVLVNEVAEEQTSPLNWVVIEGAFHEFDEVFTEEAGLVGKWSIERGHGGPPRHKWGNV
jgi:hypothetical protein